MLASFIVIVVDVLVEVVVTSLLLERLVVHDGMQCLRTANAHGQTGQVFWGAKKRRAPSAWPHIEKGCGLVHASQLSIEYSTLRRGEKSGHGFIYI